MPGSTLVAHDASVSRVMDAGAPRLGWKLRFHGPPMVASEDSAIAGKVRAGAAAGLRKTTKTVPQGSRCSGTVVRPFAMI